MEAIFSTWHWSISGFLIGFCMLLLIYFGKTFGMSSNIRTMCTICGAGKFSSFYDVDWRNQKWNLAVVFGAMIGGYVATHFLHDSTILQLNPKTNELLQQLNIDTRDGIKIAPDAIFGSQVWSSFPDFSFLLIGGILIGLGTAYAGGCTSGHAITGLSNLQLPSLIAVVGFFIGGLISVHFLLPLIFG